MRKPWRYVTEHFVPSKNNAYRPHLLRRGMLIFFLSVSLAAEGFLVANLVVRQSGENFLAAVLPGELISLTNSQRSAANLGAVAEQTQLDAAAQAKANDMAAKGYFAHIGPDGREPWAWVAGAGYNYQYAGENLAVRFVDSKDVVDAWMASPSHRANIVKPVYTEIGIGVANGLYQGQPATFVVQYFAAPSAPFSEARGTLGPSTFASAKPGSVKGLQTGPAAAGNSFTQGVEKQFARLLSEPRDTTQWILGGVALLLLVTLALAFFIHIHVQSGEMLLSGAAVAVFVISLIAINTQLLSATIEANNAASVAFSQNIVVIDPAAASTAR